MCQRLEGVAREGSMLLWGWEGEVGLSHGEQWLRSAKRTEVLMGCLTFVLKINCKPHPARLIRVRCCRTGYAQISTGFARAGWFGLLKPSVCSYAFIRVSSRGFPVKKVLAELLALHHPTPVCQSSPRGAHHTPWGWHRFDLSH